eukprot:2874528-Rhodomonas_salina.1
MDGSLPQGVFFAFDLGFDKVQEKRLLRLRARVCGRGEAREDHRPSQLGPGLRFLVFSTPRSRHKWVQVPRYHHQGSTPYQTDTCLKILGMRYSSTVLPGFDAFAPLGFGVQFYLEEKKGNIDYLGWSGKQDSDYSDDVNLVQIYPNSTHSNRLFRTLCARKAAVLSLISRCRPCKRVVQDRTPPNPPLQVTFQRLYVTFQRLKVTFQRLYVTFQRLY